MSLQIDISEPQPGRYRITLAGRLDTETHEELDQRIKKLLATEVLAVNLDLSGLEYLSSMGLRVLLSTFKQLRARKAHFLMAHVQPQIKKVFEIAAALPPETIFASIAEADKYLDTIQKRVLEEGQGG